MLSSRDLFALAAHATDSGGNAFYRELYGLPHGTPALDVQNMDEWRALPILTKDALARKTLAERSFVPLSDLDHVRASSGTSGKVPLFSPRTNVRGMDYRLRFHDFKKPFLAFTVPLMPHWHEMFQKEHDGSPHVLCLDPKEPLASAKLAQAAGADAFSAFVYHVRDLGEAMKALGTNTEIRFIEVTGEVCSRAQVAYMNDVFPNATIVQSYNSSEIEDAHMGIPCRPLTLDNPVAHYHPKKSHFLEIINPESGTVIEPHVGAEGDLLVTTYPGEPASFPLIRFRIGDTIRIMEAPCHEHGVWSFTVLGRTDMDFIKIPGGLLRADEIARVLRLFPSQVSDVFELHYSEIETPTGPQLKFVLHIESRGDVNLDTLAVDIASTIRVAPAMTYADGVASARYLPLTCQPLTLVAGTKIRRIVRH